MCLCVSGQRIGTKGGVQKPIDCVQSPMSRNQGRPCMVSPIGNLVPAPKTTRHVTGRESGAFSAVAGELTTTTRRQEGHKMFGTEQFVVKMSLNGAVNDGPVAHNTLRAHKARPAAFSISRINNR